MTGPERKAAAIARSNPRVPAKYLAKRAGVRVEVARRLLQTELRRREQAA